jgi:hypothetical protein
MSFYNGKNKVIHDYILSNSTIERVHEFNDLGVIVQDNLSWDTHIINCVKKANSRLAVVKRCLDFNCSINIKLTCYTSLVRPILEYGATVWSDNVKKHMKLIEGVQRKATVFILGNTNMSYEERLLKCELLPLAYRRELNDIIFLYNNIHDLNDCNLVNVNFQGILNGTVNTRSGTRDELHILPNRIHLNNYANFFINSIRTIWNNLPYDLRSCELSDSGKNTPMKRQLKEFFTNLLVNTFNSLNKCTWSSKCTCQLCKIC